jgi:hypothetical protein
LIGTFTVDAGTNVITTSVAHGLAIGDVVRVATVTGVLPAGMAASTDYYVLTVPSTTTLTVSTIGSGTTLDITGAGTIPNNIHRHTDGPRLSLIAAGSTTTPARYGISITPTPISGAFRLTWGQKQVAKVNVQANTATAQVWTITPRADSGADLESDYFDIPDDSNVTCRFWFDIDNNGGGAAPATPTGGRLVEITTVNTGDSAIVIGGKIADAMIADGDWTAAGTTVSATGVVTATAAVAGLKTATTSAGTSGFTVSIATAGVNGQLQGQAFVMDDVNGTVGVYVTVGGLPTTVPATAAACTRQIAVAIASGATASTAATNLATAIGTTDAVNAASASGSLLTITDGSNGTRAGSTTVSSSSYFSTTISQEGASVVATIDKDASATEFSDAIGDLWTVTKTADYNWTMTSVALGTPSAPSIENDSLTFLIGMEGTLAFDTLALYEAFAASTSNEITNAVLEIKATFTGYNPRVSLQYPCTLTRDLLDGEITTASGGGNGWLRFSFTITSYTGGTSVDLDSIVSANLTLPYALGFFEATDGFVVYQLQSGTDAEASPSVIRPDDYATTTNERVWIRRN